MDKPCHSQVSDADLVARVLAGDKAAFGRLIKRHQGRLERLLYTVLPDPLQVDDIWQETLLRAYLNLEQLRDPARFGAWFYSIALNLARSQRSLVLPGLLSLETTNHEWLGPSGTSPEEIAIKQDISRRVRQAIASLPPAEREAVKLVYLQELSHKEAAVELGASLGTIKVRVHRGRHRLRNVLQADQEAILQTNLQEINMIKATVHDVIVPRPNPTEEDKANPELRFQDILAPHRIIILKEEQGERAIAIWIGPFEADSILSRLRDISHLAEFKVKRPLTYDLTRTLLEIGNVTVERVAVSRLHEETFYATLTVKAGDELSEVDCRPSDAVSLALRVDAPIFIAPEVMAACGFTSDASGNYTWEQYQAEANLAKENADEHEVKPLLWFSLLQINDEQIQQLLEARKKFFDL